MVDALAAPNRVDLTQNQGPQHKVSFPFPSPSSLSPWFTLVAVLVSHASGQGCRSLWQVEASWLRSARQLRIGVTSWPSLTSARREGPVAIRGAACVSATRSASSPPPRSFLEEVAAAVVVSPQGLSSVQLSGVLLRRENRG